MATLFNVFLPGVEVTQSAMPSLTVPMTGIPVIGTVFFGVTGASTATDALNALAATSFSEAISGRSAVAHIWAQSNDNSV